MIRNRPAESTGLAAALALLIARAIGVSDPDTITAIAVVVGALPAVVTWIVEAFRKPLARDPYTGPERRKEGENW